MNERILFVDDDANVLAAYQRTFREAYAIDVAASGDGALELLADGESYAVVVSDMQMPGMDGVQLLAEVRRRAQDTVRIMLTGQSDVKVAMDAVNAGSIFRFLTKPCPPEVMSHALQAAVEHYALITAERELLQNTLSGSVKVLSDLLAMASPAAFGRASRVSRLVRRIARAAGTEADWSIIVGSMLSQIGCLTLPERMLEKVAKGMPLTSAEATLFGGHPLVGHDLIANIPRLGAVAAIIKYQEKHFDGSGTPRDDTAGEAIPAGARMLKVALDLDALVATGVPMAAALVRMRGRLGWYDPRMLAAMAPLDAEEPAVSAVRPIDLRPGMVFAADVVAASGTLLVTKGQEVTPSLRIRLMNIDRNEGLVGELRVVRVEEFPVS